MTATTIKPNNKTKQPSPRHFHHHQHHYPPHHKHHELSLSANKCTKHLNTLIHSSPFFIIYYIYYIYRFLHIYKYMYTYILYIKKPRQEEIKQFAQNYSIGKCWER